MTRVLEFEANLKKIKNIMRMLKKTQYKKFNFTNLHIECLLILLKAKNINMNDLSCEMSLNGSTITNIINILEKQELVLRKKNKKDKRVIVVSLSRKGEKVSLGLKDDLKDYYSELLRHISEEQLIKMTESIAILESLFLGELNDLGLHLSAKCIFCKEKEEKKCTY